MPESHAYIKYFLNDYVTNRNNENYHDLLPSVYLFHTNVQHFFFVYVNQ